MVARDHWIVIIDDEEEGERHCRQAVLSQFLGCQDHRKEDEQEPAFTGHLSTLLTGAWEALFNFYFKTV